MIGRRLLPYLLPTMVAMAVVGCTSALDLDVDRKATFMDRQIHPTSMSLYYYYDTASSEVLFRDTYDLNKVYIDTTTSPITVRFDHFSSPLLPHGPSTEYPTVVRGFGFSLDAAPCDASQLLDVTNAGTYFYAQYRDLSGVNQDNLWFVDGSTRRFRIKLVEDLEGGFVKCRIYISVDDPVRNGKTWLFNGLLTLDYR